MKFDCYWHDVECKNNMNCDECDLQPPDDEKPNGKKEPVLIGWNRSYGGTYPECPVCGEMPYSLDRCIFCGQRFIKDARAEEWSKPPKVEYMDCFLCGGKNTVEFTRAQSNGHRHGHCTVCGMSFME